MSLLQQLPLQQPNKHSLRLPVPPPHSQKETALRDLENLASEGASPPPCVKPGQQARSQSETRLSTLA